MKWVRQSWAGAALCGALALGCGSPEVWVRAEIEPSEEDVGDDGTLYTPSTQSFLRGHHKLETAVGMVAELEGTRGHLQLTGSDGESLLEVRNLELAYLVPRFHYPPASPPDDFDAFNIMLAEYSRNGLSVPTGKPGDTMAHFESDLEEVVPWRLAGDYDFIPSPGYRPLRVGVTNNCLGPGLWEVNALDRAGEIYHGWMRLPAASYQELVARINGTSVEFAQRATAWSSEPVPLELDRLRGLGEEFGEVPVSLAEGTVGYSSQDSRRKIHKGFARVKRGDERVSPELLSDLHRDPVEMSSFVEPGKYSLSERREFDFSFLSRPQRVTIRRVHPKTKYEWQDPDGSVDLTDAEHLELTIELDDKLIILGNLPMPLLVRQEDFGVHGFGVGVLEASSYAERREFLMRGGPHPPYAYLAERRGGRLVGLNSHDFGIEQIFIRTHPFADAPYWIVTITSYERIIDLAKYRIGVPPALVEPLRSYSRGYVSPVYFTYRDDNLG